MSGKDVIIEQLGKKEAEIQSLEAKLRSAKIYAQALQDVLNVLNRGTGTSGADTVLKPKSSVALAREEILRAGQPLHISALLAAAGKGITKEGRASLGGSLAAYVRRGEIFTRTGPNTFGLIEMGHTPEQEDHIPEPPEGFGGTFQPSTELDEEIPF
jgi:hypothetical protein